MDYTPNICWFAYSTSFNAFCLGCWPVNCIFFLAQLTGYQAYLVYYRDCPALLGCYIKNTTHSKICSKWSKIWITFFLFLLAGIEDVDIEQYDPKKSDPEYFVYDCLNIEEVEKLLNETVDLLSSILKCSASLAKTFLLEHRWCLNEIVSKYRDNNVNGRVKSSCGSTTTTTTLATITTSASSALTPTSATSNAASSIEPPTSASTVQPIAVPPVTNNHAMCTRKSSREESTANGATKAAKPNAKTAMVRSQMCSVCAMYQPNDKFHAITCDHSFCKDCWSMHFETQINQGISTSIYCMAPKCDLRVPEDLVLRLMHRPQLRSRYQRFAFQDYVKSHPELRFCPGPNCQIIIRSQDISPKKVICVACKSSFCFKCGNDYHAPTECQIIKKWLTKCADDSETANYISAHTKDCPKCHICIEKNGGCNHMQCFSCKHDFCWMCLGDWKSHGSEYYECSRYKENPNIANESVHAQAREALKKYLHYYERWDNHSKSFTLEQQTVDRLKTRINEKVMKGLGTWIDWQYLFNAATLLAKCRYTLQYTYPYAYFMESGSRKVLFEYQQVSVFHHFHQHGGKFHPMLDICLNKI